MSAPRGVPHGQTPRWKGEWKEYYTNADGKQAYHHLSQTWPKATYTKAEAQSRLDDLLRELQQGGPKADGTMTLSAFWESVFYPIKAKRWGLNTRKQVDYLWKKYIEAHLGGRRLAEIKRPDVEMFLVKADARVDGRRSYWRVDSAGTYRPDARWLAEGR